MIKLHSCCLIKFQMNLWNICFLSSWIARNYVGNCLSLKFPHQEIRWNFVVFLWSVNLLTFSGLWSWESFHVKIHNPKPPLTNQFMRKISFSIISVLIFDPFQANVPILYTPWKHQKTFGGGRGHWPKWIKMVQLWLCFLSLNLVPVAASL